MAPPGSGNDFFPPGGHSSPHFQEAGMPPPNRVSIAILLSSILLLGAVIPGCLQNTSGDQVALTYQILTPVNIALQNSTVKSYLTGNWTINGVALDARVTRAGGGQPENS